MKSQPKPARIYFIVAREKNVAVIFRRGPTKWTQIIKWDLNNDSFEYGQWFKGRIYERRCDLSPSAKYMVYFASKITRKQMRSSITYAWTAVSKPPFLTALALWPKGDCWHGGGLFKDDDRLLLNHRPEQAKIHPDFSLKKLKVTPNEAASGEDNPIFSKRLTRDGWEVIQEWDLQYRGWKVFYKTITSEIREKKVSSTRSLLLERSLNKLKYKERYFIQQGKHKTEIETAQWIDVDHKKRILIASEGKLYVLKKGADFKGMEELKMLADLNLNKPEQMEAPDFKKDW